MADQEDSRSPFIGVAPKRKQPLPTELNVRSIVFGRCLMKPSYPSLYREEVVGKVVERLYVCPVCFRYTNYLMSHLGHMQFCKYLDTTGHQIYSNGRFTLFEVDGEEYKLFAQNLSLFAKLFIGTKSVCYDIHCFKYYLLQYTREVNGHCDIVGFFSKEKLSWDNNNLACILVFPPWQRRRFGQMLMGASYAISKMEGKLGGPERPLSEMAKQSYQSYWSREIARAVLQSKVNKQVTIQEISEDTYILPEDIVSTLLQMGVLGTTRMDGSKVVAKDAVRDWLRMSKIDARLPIAEDGWLSPEEIMESKRVRSRATREREDKEEEDGPDEENQDVEDQSNTMVEG